jgi:hypothetical protein
MSLDRLGLVGIRHEKDERTAAEQQRREVVPAFRNVARAARPLLCLPC